MSNSKNFSGFLEDVSRGLPLSWDWRQPVIIGVSGGADSLALLYSLAELSRGENNASVVVAHVEYDLRAEASCDRECVVQHAEQLGFPCYWKKCRVQSAQGAQQGDGTEALARRLRYDFFSELAFEIGARHVAVGHTRDDQAETILHRLLRGTGLGGVAGMPATRELSEGVSLVRPLLHIRRQQPRDFLQAIGQAWRDDESNQQLHFARNFLRHRVLAEVERGPYPAAVEALVRFGEQASAVMASRLQKIDAVIEKGVEQKNDGKILIHQKGIGDDSSIVPEALIEIWKRKGWPRQELSSKHLNQLTEMIFCGVLKGAPVPNAVDLPGGIHARLLAGGVSLQQK
ncbi:MAG: tRNA lysidine(34) synthetase TilS [Planctomycetaceae bacterium]|nr:tRNA lysidine(34) synthetase TilS [Planctomycetaceae bacterium]